MNPTIDNIWATKTPTATTPTSGALPPDKMKSMSDLWGTPVKPADKMKEMSDLWNAPKKPEEFAPGNGPDSIAADTPEAAQARASEKFTDIPRYLIDYETKQMDEGINNASKIEVDIGKNLRDTFSAAGPESMKDPESFLNQLGSRGLTLGHAVADVVPLFANGFGTLVKMLVPKDIRDAVGSGIETLGKKLNDIPGYTDKANAINHFLDQNDDVKKSITEDLPNLVMALIGGGEKGAGQLNSESLKTAVDTSKDLGAKTLDVANNASQSLIDTADKMNPMNKSAMSPEDVNKTVVENYTKAVKPTIAGKTTKPQIDKYNSRVVDAVNTISKNKADLSFVDDSGEVVKGRTPESLAEMQDAIQQTKASIFKQYDAMAKSAGEAGGKVDLKPVASELDTVINDPALRIQNPGAIDYARSVKERLLESGKIDTETSQKVVELYNRDLKSFYRNPSYETASRAAIDAMVVNKIRGALDDTISNLQGDGYQKLKNQYGSLKEIESDVNKRAQVVARQNNKGLFDFTDVFSGAEIVKGLLTLNPKTAAVGVTARLIKQYYKYLNSPDRAIRKMFDAVDSSKSGDAPASQGANPQPSSPQSQTPITPNREASPNANTDTENKQGNLFEGSTPSGLKYKIEK